MDTKAVKKSVSFPPALLSRAEAKAGAEYGRNLSRYVQAALERDLAGTVALPSVSDSNFLERLYAAILPSRVARFHRLWQAKTRLGVPGPSQAELVESFLIQLLKEFEASPTAELVDAYDALPEAVHASLAQLAGVRGAESPHDYPKKIVYLPTEDLNQCVAEDDHPMQPQIPTPEEIRAQVEAPARTLRTLPRKPPKPPSTGTTP